MTTKQKLEEARGLIEKPENWLQYALSDGHGRFCAIGAIMKVEGISNFQNMALGAASPFGALSKVTGGIATYNNTHSHECVLAAFDTAIERAS